jgi:hypothetical protein
MRLVLHRPRRLALSWASAVLRRIASASPSAGRTAEQIAQARAFHTQGEVKSAAKALGELAKKRAPASCIHPDRR